MKPNPAFHGRYVQGAGGTQLFAEETGDPTKPTIFWLHGYCQSRLSWDRQFESERLASQFHMVRMDLRGHGLSDKLTDPAAFQDSKNWADDIQAVPTLIVQGNNDRIVLPVYANFIASHVNHASRVDYDNCGHVPFVEAAERFNQDVAAFMQTVHG